MCSSDLNFPGLLLDEQEKRLANELECREWHHSRNYLVLAILTPRVSSSIMTGSTDEEPFLRLRGALFASSWRFFSSRRSFFASASPGWTKSFSTKSLNCKRKN